MDSSSSILSQALAQYRQTIHRYNEHSWSALSDGDLQWLVDGPTSRDEIAITDGTRPPPADPTAHLHRLKLKLLEIASPDISELDLPSDYIELMSITDGLDIEGLPFERHERTLVASAEQTEQTLRLDPSTVMGRTWIAMGLAYGAREDLALLREMVRYKGLDVGTPWRCGGGSGEGLDIFYAYVRPTDGDYSWKVVWCGHGDTPVIFNSLADLVSWYGASVNSLLSG
ncbi:hypothetical protein Aspvir_003260 [Aspergillus viridinutans]|uniref:Uncharacterized protein n=1 Tax=Aspergillus viridinutans TaxID=75553 RepID=A0A9P3C4I1_ASPVI|nr:uncharacterized protein Aspvir_003260 [Aspergillus viridinutans]GIK07594.1 hypothetical protein Aspvir_003260 [Aspergillus viridinutans]